MAGRRTLMLTAAVVAMTAMLLGQEARADFEYGTQVSPNPYSATSGDMVSQLNQSGIGNFASPSSPSFDASAPGGTNITVASLQIQESNGTAPFHDSYANQAVSVDVKIRDLSSGLTGVFTFNGLYTQSPNAQFVSSNGTSTASNFNNPWSSFQSQSMVIGSTIYTVTIFPDKAFTAPNPPDIATGVTPPDRNGSFVFNVAASPAPEPSSMVLMGIGLVGGILTINRRNKVRA